MLIKKTRIPVLHIVTIGFLPSPLKKIIYRLKGYKIAKGVKLSLGCVIIGKEIEIGEKSSVGFFTIIRADKITIKRFVKIGAMSAIDTGTFFIDDDARINEQVYVGGIKKPQSALIMGKRTIIMQASYINPTEPIMIGDDSGIGGHCLLFTHGSWNSQLEGYPVKFAPITIGKKVWLPWRVFIMPGVNVGDGAVIAADSTVMKDIPAYALAAGSPARVVKENVKAELSFADKKKIIETVFAEFTEHLRSHRFIVEERKGDHSFASIIKKKKPSFIYYTENSPAENPPATDNILVLNTTEEIKPNPAYKMIISLQRSERIGSSDVGEELVQFFSRYGIRFNRLD